MADWLIVIPTVPSSTSSLRVTVWRRMRGAGALSLHGGVWILPNLPEQEKLAVDVLAQVRAAGGDVMLLTADLLDSLNPEAVRARFRNERDQEYAELAEGCGEFLAEIEKETAREKFTYPELEEIEGMLARLHSWLKKIRARDFFGAPGADEAARLLSVCEQALEGYARRVYLALGVEGDRGGSGDGA